jgi:hypothetical protein
MLIIVANKHTTMVLEGTYITRTSVMYVRERKCLEYVSKTWFWKMQVVRSKDFETLLLMDPSTKVIEVPEMTGDQLRVFVSFFYTGEISANDLLHHTTAFLLAADKYKVPYLGAVCEDALIANLSRQNAITTFDIVKNHCSDATKEAVLKKAMKMGELSQYEEYKLYTTKNPALLLELYEQLSEPIESTPTKKHRVAPGKYPWVKCACSYQILNCWPMHASRYSMKDPRPSREWASLQCQYFILKIRSFWGFAIGWAWWCNQASSTRYCA